MAKALSRNKRRGWGWAICSQVKEEDLTSGRNTMQHGPARVLRPLGPGRALVTCKVVQWAYSSRNGLRGRGNLLERKNGTGAREAGWNVIHEHADRRDAHYRGTEPSTEDSASRGRKGGVQNTRGRVVTRRETDPLCSRFGQNLREFF